MNLCSSTRPDRTEIEFPRGWQPLQMAAVTPKMNEPGNAGTTSRMGENRRMYPRRRIERLAYVDFGPDNGGMLIDISEGGLSFQGVGRMSKGQPLHLRFTLPGAGSWPW